MSKTAKRPAPWPCRAAGGTARRDGKCARCLADPGAPCPDLGPIEDRGIEPAHGPAL